MTWTWLWCVGTVKEGKWVEVPSSSVHRTRHVLMISRIRRFSKRASYVFLHFPHMLCIDHVFYLPHSTPSCSAELSVSLTKAFRSSQATNQSPSPLSSDCDGGCLEALSNCKNKLRVCLGMWLWLRLRS